jgi:hypothetical protein
MQHGKLLIVAVCAVLTTVPLAHAQLAINVPVPTPSDLAPAGAPGVMVDQPDAAMAEFTAPVVGPPPAVGSSPGSAAGTSDPSAVTVYSNGVYQRVKTYSDYGPVREFDPAQGLLTMQDGTVVTFPPNFAFTSPPEPGQPITIYYFQDQNGTAILSAVDPGTQGSSNGS